MAKGLRAFDKVDASELFDRTWVEFAPAKDGVDVVLRVREAPAQPGRDRVRVHGVGEGAGLDPPAQPEHAGLRRAGGAAPRGQRRRDAWCEAELRGERLFVTGFGYRVTGRTGSDKPRFFDEDGEEINRARFERDGVDLALRTSLERWGLVEGGVRFGRVTTIARGRAATSAEADRPGGSSCSARLVVDTLDDLEWPEHGRRLAVSGDWNLSGLGAEREYWRLEVVGPGRPVRWGSASSRRSTPSPGSRATTCPSTTGTGWAGSRSSRATTHEELKGAQALAAAVSLRSSPFRPAPAGRAGRGGQRLRDAPTTSRSTALRWGVGVGRLPPEPHRPVSRSRWGCAMAAARSLTLVSRLELMPDPREARVDLAAAPRWLLSRLLESPRGRPIRAAGRLQWVYGASREGHGRRGQGEAEGRHEAAAALPRRPDQRRLHDDGVRRARSRGRSSTRDRPRRTGS